MRGTVSRVDPPKKRGEPARMYFKESPDGAFIACVWPHLFGDLNQSVSERLEVRGRVTRPTCGGAAADLQVSIPAASPRPVVRERSDRSAAAQRNDVPQPAPAPPPSAAAARAPARSTTGPATASASIPPGTRINVRLIDAVDLTHANNGDTFRAQTLGPIALPGSAALPQGTAIVLRFSRTAAGNMRQALNGQQAVSAGVTLQSIEIDEQAVPVSSNSVARILPAAGAPNFRASYPAGMRLAFVVTAAR